MFRFIFISILFFCYQVNAQELAESNHSFDDKRFSFGANLGIGWTFEDKAHLFNTSAGFIFDYHLKNKFYVQFAPRYVWLWKWNEHYLALPVHIRKKLGDKLSVFGGPALIFDIGYFKDLGISAGMYYHLGNRSALILSAFTFTLYDYHIDYLYVPLSLSYNYSF